MTRREIEGWTVEEGRAVGPGGDWPGSDYVGVDEDGASVGGTTDEGVRASFAIPPAVLAAVLPDDALAAELRARGYVVLTLDQYRRETADYGYQRERARAERERKP